MTADVIHTKTSLDPLVKGDKLVIKGKLAITAYLSEYTCSDEQLQGRTSLKSISPAFEREVSKKIKSEIPEILQRSGADVLGIKEKLEKNPERWQEIEGEFSKLLRNAEMDIDVKLDLNLKGAES